MKESRNLEFKENISSRTFLKTISAFANYGTGRILFGVRDDGTMPGIANAAEACLDLENCINDNISPVPEFSLEIQENSVICLTVCEGRAKPYLYKGKAYRRSDTATIETGWLELRRLILEGSNLSYESLPAQEQEYTFSRLGTEMAERMEINCLTKDILKTLELYTDRDGYNNAAALLADRNSFKGVDIVRFGSSINVIRDRHTLEGISVLQQYHESIRIFQTYYQYEEIDGMRRRTVDQIPEKSFREAIANALVHRTWDVNASIRVSMFEDRIEISSPGGLPAGISKEEYLKGQVSILRNPILGNVFFRLKYIERFGTGILRIQQEYEKSVNKPQFEIYDNSIQVILPLYITDDHISEPEGVVMEVLKKRGPMSRAELEQETGLGRDRTIRILNELIRKNRVEKAGAGRNTKYSIIS